MIDLVFSQLEASHGELLVRRALALLTASNEGLGDGEMEDLLSMDDEVSLHFFFAYLVDAYVPFITATDFSLCLPEKILDDVYEWWVPPVRRLPPMIWFVPITS